MLPPKTVLKKRISVARDALPVRFLECGQLCPCLTGERFAIFVIFGGESIADVKCPHESLVGASPRLNCVDSVSIPGSIARALQDLHASFWVAEFVNRGDIACSTGMDFPEDIGYQGGNCERLRYNDVLHFGGN